MLDREFFENFGALKKGVILPSCNVDKELAEMSPEDARIAKRKWRKLKRKAEKQLPGWGDKAFVKRSARRSLSDLGEKMAKETGKESK